MHILVILLDGGKRFLLPVFENTYKTESQILLETELRFSFVRTYKPVFIESKIEIDNLFEIDKQVKYYMLLYGIENIRGGSYSDIELDDYLQRTLMREFDTIARADENPPDISEYIQKYAFEDLDSVMIEKEKRKLNENLVDYRREKCIYDYLNFFLFKPYVNTDISKSIVEIDWLKTTCYNQYTVYPNSVEKKSYLQKQINNENEEKYTNILRTLRKVYDCACYLEIPDCELDNVFIHYPQFILDSFIYNHGNMDINKMEWICKKYKYMTSYIENRALESKFDVDSWGKDFEWKTKCALYLLDKIM